LPDCFSFSLTKRFHRPAFSDYAHFSFLLFFVCVFLSVCGEVAINLLLPGYMTYTSSRIFWSFHTPYRVPSLPKPTAIAPVAPARSLHGNRTAVPNHKGRRFEERQRRCPRTRCRYRYAHNRWYQNTSTRIYFLSWFISSQVCNKITVSFGME